MNLKEQFRRDVDKYGYVFLGMSLTNDASGVNSLSAFDDPEKAFACYGPLQKAKDYFGTFVFYLSFEAAKKAALSGKVHALNVRPGNDSGELFLVWPVNEDLIKHLKNWFERVENGQKGKKC